MTISSAQTNCSITSGEVITLDLSSFTTSIDSNSCDTITLYNTGAGGGYITGGAGGAVGAGGGGGAGIAGSIWNSTGTISIGPLTSNDIQIHFPTEWENSFPDWNRIQKMCEEYPGLKIAFEKFKTTYNLVKDDYDTPKDKRKIP